MYKPIDASWLPADWKSRGVAATFFANGQLATLKSAHGELSLVEGKMQGSLTFPNSDWITYRENGTAENFNPFSDNARAYPKDWEEWIREAIAEVCG